MDSERPIKIHNAYGFKIHENSYGLQIFYGFQSKSIELWIFMNFKSIWFMNSLWNGYGFKILKNMGFRIDMDLVSNPSIPTGYNILNEVPTYPTVISKIWCRK